MDSSGQDELRRAAQRAMQRRIDPTARRPEADEQPRQQRTQPSGTGRRRSIADRLREMQEQIERELQQQQPAAPRQAAPPERPRVERPQPAEVEEAEISDIDEFDQPERPRRQTDGSTDPVHSGVHEGVHQGVHRGVHEDIHAGAYARPDIPHQSLGVARDLHDPATLRRTIVLMEILGKPVALRDDQDNTGPF